MCLRHFLEPGFDVLADTPGILKTRSASPQLAITIKQLEEARKENGRPVVGTEGPRRGQALGRPFDLMKTPSIATILVTALIVGACMDLLSNWHTYRTQGWRNADSCENYCRVFMVEYEHAAQKVSARLVNYLFCVLEGPLGGPPQLDRQTLSLLGVGEVLPALLR